MLNMIHASNEKQTYLSGNALTDLNMSFFADAEFSKNIGKFIVSDKDVIIMRQREFSDIMNNPELSIFLEELCKKITELSEVEKLRKDIEVYSDNESLLYAFRELLLFTDCIDLISGSAEKFNGKMFSEGFLSLFAYAEQIKNETWYINISKFISDTDESLRDIKSITLGINLDAKLRPMEAGIISFNTKPFTTNNIMDKLFAEKADSKEYICLSVLCKNEFGISSSQLSTLSGQVYYCLNEIFRRSLVKMKSIMRKAERENNFLDFVYDEIKFLSVGAEFILRMKSAGMPVCIPEITEGNDEISDLYDPNLIDFTKSADIVKNDISFDENGKIYILTGQNSGGKSVFMRAVGICYVMFQLGMPVPAKKAKMRISDGIYTHFIGKSQMRVGGRLENECKSISEMYRSMTGDSIIFMDESFSSTSAYDGTLIASEVLKRLRKKGCRCIYATHMHDIANKAEEINEMPGISKVDLMSVSSSENPYNVERKRGQGKSFAMEIFKKYGLDLD